MTWREANKPRDTNNPFFKEMSISRARFKLGLRFIKRHENQLKQDAIADAMCNDGDGKFWKEIRKSLQIMYPYLLALTMPLEKMR